MKTTKLTLALAISLVCGCCAYADNQPDWSPAETMMNIRGTVRLPPETCQKLGLPGKVSFGIKGNLSAKQVGNESRSRAGGNYSLVVTDLNAEQVYCDVNTSFSLESSGTPHEALLRAHALVGRTLSAALGVESKSSWPTNSLSLPLELNLDKFELKVK
jgi:hypothetical protein